MSTNIKSEAIVLDRSADAANVMWIFLDNNDLITLFTKKIGRCKAGRPGANDRDIGMVIDSVHDFLRILPTI